MARGCRYLWVPGLVAVSLLFGMAVWLQFWIKPVTGFLPQSPIKSYTTADLVAFGTTLKEAGLDDAYRFVIGTVDPVFFTTFGLWVLLTHLCRGNVLVGAVLAACAVGFDWREGHAILAQSGLAGAEVQVVLPVKTSPVFYITLGKCAAFIACLVSVWVVSRRRRRA